MKTKIKEKQESSESISNNEVNCLSCNQLHNSKYCPNCGERQGVERITLSSMVEDVISSLTSMDRGYLYNLKTLTLNPQVIISNYLSGKRKGIFNPISYLVLSITLYLLVYPLLNKLDPPSYLINTPDSGAKSLGKEVGKYIVGNLKLFWALTIIPLAISLKLVLKKQNFYEHLATSSFFIGHSSLIAIVTFFIIRLPIFFDPLVYLSLLWLVYRLVSQKQPKVESFFLSVAIIALFMIQIVLTITVMAVVVAQLN